VLVREGNVSVGKGREWEDLEGVEWGGKGETKGWMGRWIGMERCGGGA